VLQIKEVVGTQNKELTRELSKAISSLNSFKDVVKEEIAKECEEYIKQSKDKAQSCIQDAECLSSMVISEAEGNLSFIHIYFNIHDIIFMIALFLLLILC
jgi:hypothetical protein